IAQAQAPDRTMVTPELLGRLGWWYYRAGKYETAQVVLSQAHRPSPGKSELAVRAGLERIGTTSTGRCHSPVRRGCYRDLMGLASYGSRHCPLAGAPDRRCPEGLGVGKKRFS